MPWLDPKENWLAKPRKTKQPPQPVEKSYSVTEVAEILSVDRKTVFKWLVPDEETGEAIIAGEAWYKLPGSGHIRIRESGVRKLQDAV